VEAGASSRSNRGRSTLASLRCLQNIPSGNFDPVRCSCVPSRGASWQRGLALPVWICIRGTQQRVANTVRTTVWETSPLTSALLAKWILDGTADRIIAFKRTEVSSRHELAKRILSQIKPPAHATPHWWIALPEAWRADRSAANAGSVSRPGRPLPSIATNVPIAVRICLAAVTGTAAIAGWASNHQGNPGTRTRPGTPAKWPER
jgi:hypothetical protein